MKTILFSTLLSLSAPTFATNLRELCENAYYADAGGVTQLHHYQATVEFGKLSDELLVQLESILYGEGPLKSINEFDFEYNGHQLTTLTLKEITGSFEERDYILALDNLAKFPGVSVRCK